MARGVRKSLPSLSRRALLRNMLGEFPLAICGISRQAALVLEQPWEESELLRPIEVLRNRGMSGFFMHSRAGLQVEYLGGEWFRTSPPNSEWVTP
jgi:hypothetical protein